MRVPTLQLFAVAVFIEVFGAIAGTPSLIRYLGTEFTDVEMLWKDPPLTFSDVKVSPPEGERLKGTGTAVALTNDGIALTNEHVVRGCSSVTLTLGSSVSIAEVIKRSQTYDLALLRVSLTAPKKSLRFQISEAKLGEQVTVFGYPLSSLLSAGGNLTTGNISALDGGTGRPHLIQLSAPVQAGSSGSGVFNNNNELIGLIESKLDSVRTMSVIADLPQNVNFAVASNVIRNFFTEYPNYKKSSQSKLFGSHATKVLKLQNSTYHVKCYVKEI